MGIYRTFTGSGSDIYKFSEIGQAIEGTFVELRKTAFKFPNLILMVSGKETTVSMSTGMMNCLEEAFGPVETIPVGVGIRFEFTGLGKAKPGQQPFKRFTLGVDESTVPESLQLGGHAPAAADDEVPF